MSYLGAKHKPEKPLADDVAVLPEVGYHTVDKEG